MLKVGELAKKTGVSVRTLHYYDEIGLLSPRKHTHTGHRLYGSREVACLQQIKSMQALGFALKDIGDCLKRGSVSVHDVVRRHLRQVDRRIALLEQLRGRLQRLDRRMRESRSISTDDFIQTIEGMTMFEKYYTPEQLKELEERGAVVGQERIREVQGEWQQLFDDIRREIEKGTDPTSEPALALARKYRGLIEEFTGGNPEIENSLRTMYQNEPGIAERYGGPDAYITAYIGKAIQALS